MVRIKKLIFLLITLLFLTGTAFAQYDFPSGDFWTLDAGIGLSSILVRGSSFQGIIEPKLWLSPAFITGAKFGINYSSEQDKRDIFTIESQAFFRWNFFKLGSQLNPTNFFVQGGIGLLAAYRGWKSPFDDVRETRGSILLDAAAGVTIPLSQRWHIETAIRGGYPHIMGISITTGYKFPLPKKSFTQFLYVPVAADASGTGRIEFIEIIRTLPPNEIIQRMMISSVEFILFGPDIGRYNVGIDNDAQGLNELVIAYVARTINENPNLIVRIEGHANPVTTDPNEADELMVLSSLRANAVADQLRARGVSEDQMVIISFGGTRTVTSDHDIWNRNRRVELIIIEVDHN